MLRFQIPKAYLPGFQSFLTLQPAQVEQIVDFLSQVPVGTGPKTFTSLFDETFKKEAALDRRVAASLYSLGSFRFKNEGTSQQEIVDGFSQSFHEQTAKKYSDDEIKKFSDILSKFFDANDSLSLSFKAFHLLTEKENVFRENHIITDIRLLFKDEIKDPKRYGLVTHQLRLEADDSGEAVQFYFNLTEGDLSKLQQQITRALEKEKLIKNDYADNISFINITE